jgi:hypothetical protein
MSLKLRDEIDGKLTSTGEEILGVDNATGKLGHWFYGSNGFHGSGHWFRDGDSWAIKWRSLEPGGKVYDGVGDHIQIDADTYEWQIRDFKENGKAIDDWPKVTFRRKLGIAADEDDLWQAYRDASVGTWLGESEVLRDDPGTGLSKGDKFKMLITEVSALGGMAIVGESKFEVPEKSYTSDSRWLTGWDPDTRQARLLAIWSGGEVEELVIARHRGKIFYGTYSSKKAGQATFRARISVDYETPDTCVLTLLDGPQKGQELNRFKRVK